MASISGKLVDNAPSAAYTPIEKEADVVVVNNAPGDIILEAHAPGIAKPALVCKAGGSFSIRCIDPAITYTLRSLTKETDVDYYMGP